MSERLFSVLPDSLNSSLIAAVGQSVGDAEQLTLNHIPLVAIWSRLPELSEEHLDHLAWHLHIDGYSYATSKAQKLWLVQNFHDWHRYKGTLHGHALYWRVLLDREVNGAAPRYNSFLGSSLTDAERKVFEDLHPEIRIYPFRNKGVAHGFFFDAATTQRFYVRSDAYTRVGRQVYSFDPVTQIETKLNTLPGALAESEPVAIAQAGKACGAFMDVIKAPRFYVASEAGQRLYTITTTTPDAAATRSESLTARPLTPMCSNYTLAWDYGIGKGIFPGNRYTHSYPDKGGTILGGYIPRAKTQHKIYFVKSDASDRLYKKLKLFDPSRAYDGTRNARAFLGCFRLGKLPAHTGEISVDATGVASQASAFFGNMSIGCTFFTVSDAADRIKQIIDVGRMPARASDKVMISISNYKPACASAAHKSGSIICGAYELKVI